MPEDMYRKSWNRQNRGLLVFLLDQSGSMEMSVSTANQVYSNGVMATTTLNHLIDSVIKNTPHDPQRGGIKDYCDMYVLGYGDYVTPLLDNGHDAPISIRDLAPHPKGHKAVLVERFDRAQGKNVWVKEMQPYWVEYRANSNYTEMAKGLQKAHQIVHQWLHADPRRSQSFPPIIINITDGMHNGTGNPVDIATSLCQLYTNDGHVLLYNCHLTSHGDQRLVFPKTIHQLDAFISDQDEREGARQLFAMSSIIPLTMVRKARTSFKAALEEGAKGFLYNANPGDLIDFLRWGTQPSENIRN